MTHVGGVCDERISIQRWSHAYKNLSSGEILNHRTAKSDATMITSVIVNWNLSKQHRNETDAFFSTFVCTWDVWGRKIACLFWILFWICQAIKDWNNRVVLPSATCWQWKTPLVGKVTIIIILLIYFFNWRWIRVSGHNHISAKLNKALFNQIVRELSFQ